MPKRVLVPLAEGFEEIEAITVIDILRRADVEVIAAGLTDGPVKGRTGIQVLPDVPLDSVRAADLDMIVLPGGVGGTQRLGEDARIQALLKELASRGKYTTAICAAPTVLSAAGLTRGKAVTSHPSVRQELTDARYREDRVVVDGPVVTSRAPGTAMEFAMKLVEVLEGPDKVAAVNQGVLARL